MNKKCLGCSKLIIKPQKYSYKQFRETNNYCNIDCRWNHRRLNKTVNNKNGTITIYINKGLTNHSVLIDKEDFNKVRKHKWYINSAGYVTTTIRNTNEKMFLHWIILGKHKVLVIDHINRNKLDNRKSNLRITTQSINTLNKKPTNKYGCSGIYRKKINLRKPYMASIGYKHKTYFLGYFKTAEEAIQARRNKELELLGFNIK